MIQPGNGYTVTTTPNGQTLQIDAVDGGAAGAPAGQKLEQFQILVSGNALRVVSGTVLWAPHAFDSSTAPLCAKQTEVKTYTRYTGDSVVEGTDANSPLMSQNGKVVVGT